METPRLKPEDLEAFLEAHTIAGKILRLEVPTPTVEAAAQAVGTGPGFIVKSILFLAGGKPVLAIACGPAYIDRRAVAAVFGVGRKQVKLASAEEVLFMTGYPVGGMPPFGHRFPLPTLIDRRVLEMRGEVYAGGGDESSLLRIDPQAILAAANARVIDLVTPIKHIPVKDGS